MIAVLALAPRIGQQREALQAIADALFNVNVRWIRDAIDRGLEPPRRVISCRPPWCQVQPVKYVRFHGSQPLGRSREYYDGPMMFHVGEGTCIEIAAYDAAADAVISGRSARPLVVGEAPSYHVVVQYADGTTADCTEGMQAWR